GGGILSYFWQLSSSEFSSQPTVTAFSVVADESDDVDGADSNAADDAISLPDNWVTGKVENGEDSDDTPATDTQFNALETPGSIATYTISYTGNDINTGVGSYTLTNANYTIGEAARFATDPTIFYTIKTANSDQNWDVVSNWSNTATQGPADASRYPGQGGNSNDIVIIGAHNPAVHGFAQGPVRLDVNVDTDIAALIFEAAESGESRGRLFPQSGTSHSWGSVSGDGEIQLFFNGTGTVPAFDAATTDFGDFLNEANSLWNYAHQGATGSGGRATMPSFPSEFPNLRITGSGAGGNSNTINDVRQITFTNDITVRGDLTVGNSAGLIVAGNIAVADDLGVGNGFGHGGIQFPNGTSSFTLSVDGDITLGATTGGDLADNFIEVESGNSNSTEHLIQLGGSITLNENSNGNDGYLDFFRSATENRIALELLGSTSASLVNNTDVTPDLYRIILNKGADTTSTFTFNDNFILNSDPTETILPITFTSGKLILNDPAINLTLSDGVTLSLPNGSGLEVADGSVVVGNTTVSLDGLLRVSGGSVDLNSTDIEYSNTGGAIIGVSGGTLEVGGQVRRGTTNTAGVLKYRQTGGDVDIAVDQATTTSRAAFEVLNSGSEFTLTGGTFNIERGVAGDANTSLELDPQTFDVTGSTITLFENLGADYGSNFFNINSTIALNNLVIANSIDLPDVRLFVQPLTVNNLTINSSQVFDANALDLTLTGNLLNNGTYVNNSSITTFSGNGAQSISGSGSFTLFNLTKNGLGTTTSAVDLSLGNDLRVEAGILDVGSNTISLQNDAYIESTLTNSSGNGLVFNGTSGQDLYGLANSTVSLGTVTISNPTGVDIPDGNGYNFDITQELRLNGGVFNIGGSLVSMKQGSSITEVSTFNENNMVQTNSSFTDNGLVIEFFGIAADTTIFFPVGELTYTPVQFDISSGATSGSIRVRPANERHPGIVDNVEPLDFPNTEIDDLLNSLQYYWVVVAEDVNNVLGEATFFYDQDDIIDPPSDTANFISGRLLSNGTNWDKFPPTFFDGSTQSFSVPLDIGSGVTFEQITGDYTAGLGSSNGVDNDIEGAIPDELAQYVSNDMGSGNYSDDANWTEVGTSPALTSGIGPVGAQITISNGDVITLDISNIRLFSTNIEEGGTLIVPAGVTNIRLGTVTGSGTIVLTDTELLPVGEFTDFLACDGGALEYNG
ncbi:MAG: hypothetical protein AAFQ94_30400, partial [Bacteroidota bacterium]